MTALDLQSAMSDTLLQLVLAQKAQTKKQRDSVIQQEIVEQAAVKAASSSKIYAKAA